MKNSTKKTRFQNAVLSILGVYIEGGGGSRGVLGGPGGGTPWEGVFRGTPKMVIFRGFRDLGVGVGWGIIWEGVGPKLPFLAIVDTESPSPSVWDNVSMHRGQQHRHIIIRTDKKIDIYR